VDSEQAGLAEPSDAASKRRRLDSEIELREFAKRARERRANIREKIKTLCQLPDDADQLPNAVNQFPNAANQLSNPAFQTKLPFPFIGPAVLTRFTTLSDSEDNWFYTGREIFMKLLDGLQQMRKSRDWTSLWIYGTKGYGKSHLLAALVCYLTAQEERIVYIPDYREFTKRPVAYIQTAMLFTWANDRAIQDEIITLDTLQKIQDFFDCHRNAIFFIDQVNGFAEMEIKRWLESCRAWHKSILSTSANYKSYLQTAPKQSTDRTIYLYGGFTEVSLSKD
jgi:hypothetical protein